MKLSKSSALLFGVLNGGLHGRRPVKAVRKQALVSLLYPTLIENSLSVSSSVFGVRIKYVQVYRESIEDSMGALSGSFDCTIRSPKIEYLHDPDNINPNSGVYEAVVKSVKVNYIHPPLDSASASGGIFEASILTKGVYITETEQDSPLTSSSGIYEVYLGN